MGSDSWICRYIVSKIIGRTGTSATATAATPGAGIASQAADLGDKSVERIFTKVPIRRSASGKRTLEIDHGGLGVIAVGTIRALRRITKVRQLLLHFLDFGVVLGVEIYLPRPLARLDVVCPPHSLRGSHS